MNSLDSLEWLDGLQEIIQEAETKSFKGDIFIFRKLNKVLKSRKVDLLLNLADDKACSFGELRNSIALCYNILHKANLI